MKTLATCKPTEFLKQTNLIRKRAEKWIKDIRFFEIRKTIPKLEAVPDDATDEERDAIKKRNAERVRAQARKNISEIIDEMLEKHPEQTLELLALVCFVDPADVDEHPMEEYLEAVSDMVGSKAVVGFFTSLARLGLLNT